MGHALAVAEIDAIVMGTADGLLVADAGQFRQMGRRAKAGSSGRVAALTTDGRVSGIFWSMFMVLFSCRPRTWVYSASMTELELSAQL